MSSHQRWNSDRFGAVGIVSGTTMSNVEEPIGESATVWVGVHTHVFAEMNDMDVIPNVGPLNCHLDDVCASAMRHDGKSLLKVAAEDDGDSSKGTVRGPDVLK